MPNLKIIGKNVHLSIAEKEWLGVMQRQFGCTEREALDEIIEYKREQAFLFQSSGNLALARQILQEIDEWDDERERQYNEEQEQLEQVTLILPGEL